VHFHELFALLLEAMEHQGGNASWPAMMLPGHPSRNMSGLWARVAIPLPEVTRRYYISQQVGSECACGRFGPISVSVTNLLGIFSNQLTNEHASFHR
jgi:hypothetical protein